MISANNVTLRVGKKALFEDVNIKFTEGNCYGMIGANGAGKSTFLKILSGQLEPTKGEVNITPGERLSFLQQDHYKYDEFIVLDTVIMGTARLYEIMKEKEVIYAKEDFTDEDGIRASELEAEFATMNGWEAESDAATLLNGLGIDTELHYKYLKDLTGAEKVKVLLAQALFGNPDILLLDEPTNHLDLHSIEWLEEYLNSFKGAVLIISHDRYFLDRVAQKIFEIQEGKLTVYSGNYSYYVDKKQELMEQLEAAKRRQDKEIARLSFTVERMKGWGMGNAKLMKRAFAMERRLQRIERVKTIRQEHKMKNRFKEAGRSGDEVYQLSGLQAGYDHPFHQPLDKIILRGERVAVIGDNGCGKTTLVSTLLGKLPPFAGRIYEGAGLRVGYLPQVVEFAHPERNILDTMLYETNLDVQDSRDRLAAYGFQGETVFKEVSVLSGGEKARLKLCIFMNSEINTLFLDEPTNHLDILTKEWIEDAIDDFSETMIFVSHDRYFINRFATRIWAFENGEIQDYIGTYEEYQQAKKRQQAQMQSMIPEKTEKPEKAEKKEKSRSGGKETRESRKMRREVEKRIGALEKRLEELEGEMEECGSDHVRLAALYEEKEEAENELLELYEKQEELALLAEE